ncbi:hypothetical protein DFJ74DRAFT_686776 [Hyaloraphidium curvatum]|nr:hypothetical protein DFJ74DRAFT_686776 [Hyaloraphidium curvatum]
MFHSAMGDVDIIVERTLFKVHSAVLMLNSRKLEELIIALKPRNPDGSVDTLATLTAPLYLPDETAARFATLLRWMYPGSSPTRGRASSDQPQITSHNALDLMALSVRYDSPKLTRECEEYLKGAEPADVINSTNLEDCFVRSTEYRKKGFVRLLEMCFQYLHDKVSDYSYDGDFVTMLLLAERYRLPTVRYQAWARVVSSLPSLQHTASFSRLPAETREVMKRLRYDVMCAFETVGRLVLRLYPAECGCRGRALSDWADKVDWAWADGWRWDADGTMRLSFAVPLLGTCREHEEEAVLRQVEIQQCWVAEQELYDGFEVELELIERDPQDGGLGSMEGLRLADWEANSEQS